MKNFMLLSLLTALLILSGCASTKGSDAEGKDAAVEDRDAQTGEGYEGQTGGYDDSGSMGGSSLGSYDGDPLQDPNSPLSIRTIYFEYDSAVISSEGQSA